MPKKKKSKTKDPILKTPNNVEMLEVPGGLRFVVYFSFDVKEGTNNIDKLVDLIDKEILEVRYDVVKKLGNRLGVGINFVD